MEAGFMEEGRVRKTPAVTGLQQIPTLPMAVAPLT